MRTARIRSFAHRELRGLVNGPRDALILEHVERVAERVAARTDDVETNAAVYVYALLRHGTWDPARLAEAGFAPRLIQIGHIARLHPNQFFRFRPPVVTKAALINECVHELHGLKPLTLKDRASGRVNADRIRLGAADGATIRGLLADLDSPDEETWWYTIGALGVRRKKPAPEVPGLAEALLAQWQRLQRLSDPETAHGEHRWDISAVLLAMRRLLTPADVAVALQMAGHGDSSLRQIAIPLLRKADDPAARAVALRVDLEQVRPLLGLTEGDPTPSPQDVARRLAELLAEKPDSYGRLTDVEHLGDRSCLPALTKSLGWPHPLRSQTQASDAILAIGGEEALRTAVLEVLRDRHPDVKRAAHLAGRLRLTEAVPDLIAIVRTGGAASLAAATSLASLGATEAVPDIAWLLGRIKPRYWSPRKSLIGVLMQLGPEPAVAELIGAVSNVHTRDLAMNALARCPDPRATELVTSALFHGVIRRELVRPLAERGDPSLLGALVHVVNTAPDGAIRRVATRGIHAIAGVDQAAVDAHLQDLGYTGAPRVALAWLEGHRRTLREKYPLHELSEAGKHLEERVRAQAVKSLALVGTPLAFEIIRGLADDPSRHVRACVAGALREGRPGHTGPAPVSPS